MIKDAVSEPMTPPQKGAAMVGAATVYMRSKNAIQQEYLAALKEAIQNIKKLNKKEVEVKEKLDLSEVREKLAN